MVHDSYHIPKSPGILAITITIDTVDSKTIYSIYGPHPGTCPQSRENTGAVGVGRPKHPPPPNPEAISGDRTDRRTIDYHALHSSSPFNEFVTSVFLN